ncbi:MAG TPA: dTMP kinase [Nocardioides sp.]
MTVRTTGEAPALTHAPPDSISAVLRIRDYRRLWMGLGLAALGEWVGLLAITAMANKSAHQLGAVLGQGVSEYKLANFAIAAVLFLRVVPALFLGPIAGWIADRVDRKLILITGDLARAALFASMPIVDNLWWILVATLLIECCSVVWGPAKDATIPQLVPPNRLQAANQVSLATQYGSALPGALVFTGLQYLGTAGNAVFPGQPINALYVALVLNALGYLVSAGFVGTLTTIPRGRQSDPRVGMRETIVEGWRYIAVTPLVRGLVLGILGAFAAGGVVIGLARVFVSDLGGGDTAYGLLFLSVTLGLGSGMWGGPRLLRGLSRRRLFGLALIANGVLMLPIAVSQGIGMVSLFAAALGFFAGVCWITGNTILGLEVPEQWRARTLAFVGSMIRLVLSSVLAVAPLVAGLVGRHTFRVGDELLTYGGAAVTFLIAGVVMTVVGVTSYRHMDDRKGIPLRQDLRNVFKGGGVYSATGVFVCLEGGEGAGKSTQSGLLAEWLRAEGYDVVLTFEPGDTPVGRRVREIVLSPETGVLADRTEALLYAADKAEHVETVVVPALRRGDVVITDRYVDSALAYQGAGRGIDSELERVNRWATGDLRPHLTVVLDLEPEHGLGRFEERDRIEGESAEFHERVRAAFLRMASASPEHYLVVDARLPREEIAAQIRKRVEPLLDQAVRS